MSNEISAQLVKQLRERTGAGFMECKKLLGETGGDIEQAVDLYRKSGAKAAGKKAGRATGEGAVGSYVHSNGKIGVLVEVACETDFVAKNETFQAFVKDLCMHVAATNPQALTSEELAPELVERERNVILESEEVQKKPEEFREKIVEGKMKKFFSEVCFLDQPFVKDDKLTIQELVNERIATIGENISIKRFVRYELGS
ncbi:MAG: translation elongation factor Ts [Planctomycetota bacterium]